MLNREELIEKLFNFLHTEPPTVDYLEQEPETTVTFDPYQMVAEWIALRQEVKQQGKLLRSSQDALQQALTLAKSDSDRWQTQFEETKTQLAHQHTAAMTQQQKRFDHEQEKFLKELLSIVDALDQACAHWQEEIESLSQPPIPAQNAPRSIWGRLAQWFAQLDQQGSDQQNSVSSQAMSLAEVLASNQQGVELIRRSLLDILHHHQVIPIPALGQAFDPRRMYAVGRQERDDWTENTVCQEIVRGYVWGDRMLREAQVIVAVHRKLR